MTLNYAPLVASDRAGHVASGRRLLDGPALSMGTEHMASHLTRLGPMEDLSGEAIRALVTDSGLGGRGGSGFPTAKKISSIPLGIEALVVVNGSESEPASRKDKVLLAARPHLVLDGAAVAAKAVGAKTVIIYHHADNFLTDILLGAISERKALGQGDPAFQVVRGPDGFVSGESSAIVSYLESGAAKPQFQRRSSVNGVNGRPTLVQNVETLAHLALLVRFGVEWFREAGTADHPGSYLATLAGSTDHPGTVFEVVEPTSFGRILTTKAGLVTPPSALLIGGYGGSWISGERAWNMLFSPGSLADIGISYGCGLLGVLPKEACGLRETARIATYLAGESAGQCGPCYLGLPAISGIMEEMAQGRASRGDLKVLGRKLSFVLGRGACSHPDGVVSLVDSALEVFASDLAQHLKGHPCEHAQSPSSVFPLTMEVSRR